MGEASVVAATSAVAVTLVEVVVTSAELEVAEEMHEVERLIEAVVIAADEAVTNRLIEDDLRTSSKIIAT